MVQYLHLLKDHKVSQNTTKSQYKNHRLILCGHRRPSVISIRGSSFCAQKLEPRMLKKIF